MDSQTIALLTVSLLVVAAAFQVGLAAGAPWGAAAYGGRAVDDHGDLPAAYRIGSAVAAVVLLGAAWVVLASVSLLGPGPFGAGVLTAMLWGLAALFALNTLGNARGRHPAERWGAGSLTAALTVLCVLLAAG